MNYIEQDPEKCGGRMTVGPIRFPLSLLLAELVERSDTAIDDICESFRLERELVMGALDQLSYWLDQKWLKYEPEPWWINEKVEKLLPNEVFVFGSNQGGFHGAGAAGLACRGDAGHGWRLDKWFRKAMEAPVGSPDRIGKWAVFGVAEGFQQGKEGASYGIVTITKPGEKRSVPLVDIYDQLVELWKWADENPEKHLVIAPIGERYAGYTQEEMNTLWNKLLKDKGIRNCRFVRC
jgi:uncharacterized protein (DUF433 family)